jgi:hypothetical protein
MDHLATMVTIEKLTDLTIKMDMGLDLHLGELGRHYYFNPEGLEGPGPYREPKMNITVAESLSKWLQEHKIGVPLERVVFVVGNYVEDYQPSPLYIPLWGEGRERKFDRIFVDKALNKVKCTMIVNDDGLYD